MKAIWKESFLGEFEGIFEWPAGAVVLHGEVQGNAPTLWFLCDPSEPRTERRFILVPTGGPYEDDPEDPSIHDRPFVVDQLTPENYVATFANNGFVFHCFEVGKTSDDVADVFRRAGKAPKLKEVA